LHPGGLYELYWWGGNISKQPGPDGKPGLYEIYRYYNDFIQDIPLNNGQYQSIQASVSNPNLRLTGQIDLENQRAHMWVQNKAHTWRNVVDGTANIAGIKGEIKFSGFQPNATLKVEWHAFTTQGTPSIRTSTVKADGSGTVTLTLPDNPQLTDVGIKLEAIQDP
jgi:hypothetical protein